MVVEKHFQNETNTYKNNLGELPKRRSPGPVTLFDQRQPCDYDRHGTDCSDAFERVSVERGGRRYEQSVSQQFWRFVSARRHVVCLGSLHNTLLVLLFVFLSMHRNLLQIRDYFRRFSITPAAARWRGTRQ